MGLTFDETCNDCEGKMFPTVTSLKRSLILAFLMVASFFVIVLMAPMLAHGAEVGVLDGVALVPAAPALEAAAEAPAPSTVFPWWFELLAAFGSALLAGLGWLGKKLFDYLSTKVDNEWASGIVSRIDDFALGVVSDFYQLVKEAKDRGEWSPAAAEAIKEAAVARLKSYLGPKGVAAIAKLLGAGTELEKFLGDRVELAIARSKNAGKLARSGLVDDPASPLMSALASVDP